jgi:hypothetical protein
MAVGRIAFGASGFLIVRLLGRIDAAVANHSFGWWVIPMDHVRILKKELDIT